MKMPVISALLNFHPRLYSSLLYSWLFFFAEQVSPKILADYIYSADCNAKEHSIDEFGII